MSDPHTTTTIAATAGGLSLFAGTVLGLSVPALVFGFVGGLAALKLNGEGSLVARVATVGIGTLAAAAGAHPVAEVLHPENTPTAMWIPLAALVIGFGAERLLRILLLALLNRIRQAGGLPPEDRT